MYAFSYCQLKVRLLLLVQPKWGARDTTISDVSSNTEVLIASGADGMGLDTGLYNCESATCTLIDVMQERTVEGSASAIQADSKQAVHEDVEKPEATQKEGNGMRQMRMLILGLCVAGDCCNCTQR